MTGFAASAGPPPEPAPVLLRTLASAVLLDGTGDIELPRETRGATIDWGGVFGQLVRLTGPWWVEVRTPSGTERLRGTGTASTREGDLWQDEHRLPDLSVRQQIVPTLTPPGAVRSLLLSATGPKPLDVEVISSFVPFLLPVLVEGIRPVSFRAETSPASVRLRQREFALELRWSEPPCHLFIDRGSWIGGHRDGPIGEFASEHPVRLSPGRPVALRLGISGGLARELDRSPARSGGGPAEIEAVVSEARQQERTWTAGTPMLRFPDAPALERGYEFARSALRQLYTEPGDGLTGLVAGYPWYAAIWCRDLAEMLPAVLWLGDFDWARRSVRSVFRFQARSELAILGGEAGELPMQVAPGPIFLYGTSDTTLYYPELVRRIVHHSGDAGFARELAPALERIVAWGVARCDPVTGLIRNGGEVESMSRATAALARVQYGIDAPDTTIWDSTDRTDHAIDVQVLWWTALKAVDLLGVGFTEGGGAPRYGPALPVLAQGIRDQYAWFDEGYLYDSLKDGRPVARIRPNALRAVGAGLLPPDAARRIVARAVREDLSTPWGLRTLSSIDPRFRPTSYHDGQVWPIATVWAAEAAFVAGEVELGVRFLTQIADRLIAERGGANECYRGDRPEPFNSCFLLGFSVAPFLATLFERLWGIEIDARRPALRLQPRFPAGWKRAEIDRLRVGDGSVSVRYVAPEVEISWSGPGSLSVELPSGAIRVRGRARVRNRLLSSGARETS